MLREDLVKELRNRILSVQLSGKSENQYRCIGLGAIESAFPTSTFPTGVVHEFVSQSPESASATSGFLTCLLNSLRAGTNGFCIWVSSRRLIFPPALKLFGVNPEQIIFIDLRTDKEVLWAVEESLRCSGLVTVVGEVKELTFAQSRRLQLAIEESNITAFIHRIYPRTQNPTACVARWNISPLPGITELGMPGIGFPKWNVELIKVRNGRPGSWELGWTPNGFEEFSKTSKSESSSEEVNYA